jgi:copper chaperone CopZ
VEKQTTIKSCYGKSSLFNPIFYKQNSEIDMKYIVLMLSFMFSMLLAKENTTYLKVDGMKCSYSCSGKVSNIVQNMKGVKKVDVDFEKGIATVKYDDKKTAVKDIVDGLNNKTLYQATELDVEKNKKELSKI